MWGNCYSSYPLSVKRIINDLRCIFFKVDFNDEVYVSGLATQGFYNFNDYYVKTYKLRYSSDGKNWTYYSSPNKVCVHRPVSSAYISGVRTSVCLDYSSLTKVNMTYHRQK